MTTASELSTTLQRAVAGIEDLEDLTVTLVSTDPGAIKLTVTARMPGEKSQDQRMFELMAPLFGLEATDYHAEFTFRNKRYRINGINRKAAKYPVEAEDVVTGKKWRLPISAVQRGLGRTVTYQ